METEAEKATEESLAAAAVLAEEYVRDLPAANPDAVEGTVAALLEGFRAEVAPLAPRWRGASEAARARRFSADYQAYFQLLLALRNPERGLYAKLLLPDMGVKVNGALSAMKTQEYRDAVAELLEDVKAVQGLFGHLPETFKKGTWSSDKVTLTLVAGEPPKTHKVKDVTADAIHLPEPHPYAALGLRRLVESVFTVDGTETRFPLSTEDHRGLAVLAEMAGLFDVAERHYRKHLADLAPEATRSQEHLRRRLESLPAERATAELWFRVVERNAWLREWLRARDPAFLPPEGFTDAIRQDFTDPKTVNEVFGKQLQEARDWAQALEVEPRYATTIWGTVLRARPHPDTRFVPNEPAPLAPPAPPAGPGKPNGAKPADGVAPKDGAPAPGDVPPPEAGSEKPGAEKPGAEKPPPGADDEHPVPPAKDPPPPPK
jgi:hypothetical protein